MLKGLILKDIYNIKFQFICGLAIMMYPYILLMFAGGDLFEQNGLFDPSFFEPFVYGLINYISVTTCSSFMLNTISDDYRTGWAKVQRTMPLSAEKIVGAKMLAVALIIGFLTMISLIFNIIGVIAFNVEIEPLITMPIVFACVQMITLSVSVLLGYKSRARLITPVYIIMVLIFAAGGIALIVGILNEVISYAALRIISYAGIPALAAAIAVICNKTSRQAVEGDI